MNEGILIWKGGGYAGRFVHQIGVIVRLRHHWWTGSTDDVPRTEGVSPVDGGLPEPPSRWTRFVRWFKWVITGGK
jgi:hypothetical protein